MALATRKSKDAHNKSGSDLAAMKTKYDNNKHLDYVGFDEIDSLLYQIQLLREDIDELRRYIVSSELLPVVSASGLPISGRNLASGTLYNNRGVVTIVA